MKFSQRQGIIPKSKEMQFESVDVDLKNRLWNVIRIHVLDPISGTDTPAFNENYEFQALCGHLWQNFYKLPFETIGARKDTNEEFIRKRYYSAEWYELYDFIEFIANIRVPEININSEYFVFECNKIMEQEFSGYRFIGFTISPISNPIEMEEIKFAIDETKSYTRLKVVNIHLEEALIKLSDRKNPDYRNSIKESISAVESLSKILSNRNSDTLGAALDKVKGKIKLHQSLEKAFKSLYGYTSDSGGIRHALMDNSICEFEDAKFMLVSCSAFINYLIVKADKIGITFD
jgi:hypothetical protein